MALPCLLGQLRVMTPKIRPKDQCRRAREGERLLEPALSAQVFATQAAPRGSHVRRIRGFIQDGALLLEMPHHEGNSIESAEVAPSTTRHRQYAQLGFVSFQYVAREIKIGKRLIKLIEFRSLSMAHGRDRRVEGRAIKVQQCTNRCGNDEYIPERAELNEAASLGRFRLFNETHDSSRSVSRVRGRQNVPESGIRRFGLDAQQVNRIGILGGE